MPFPKKTIFENDDATPGGLAAGKMTLTVDDDGGVTLEMPAARKPKRKPTPKPEDDFDRNLAEDIDGTALQSLAAFLIEGIEADEADRADWEETVNLTVKYLGIKLEDPAAEVTSDGTVCKMVATCMLEAALKMWATSCAELLPADGPVKVKRQDTIKPPGTQETGQGLVPEDDAQPGQEPQDQTDAAGDDLAQALEEDLNWYLTTHDKGYYPDFRKMIMQRNLVGPAFREVYRCPIKRMPISRWIMAQDLIVQGDPADLTDTTGRVTARKKVAQSTMRRMMMKGEYRDISLVQPTGKTSQVEMVISETQGTAATPTLPRDFEHTVYECYCELGSGTAHELFGALEMLDCDETGENVGYPLPYRVTIDVDSREVLQIKRFWKQGDQDHRRRQRFVKYGLIPGIGFYDWGLIHLVGNPTLAATMLQRAGVDAGLYANFPAWAMAKGIGSRSEKTVFRPMPGQVTEVPLGGGDDITKVLMPWPYKEPSAQSMALVEKLESDVKAIAGIIELPVGEGRMGNTPVGTIMSYIESVSMVPGMTHKADHTSQAEEFELLRELIAEDPQVLSRGNKSPARMWQVAEEILSPDLSPKADPNVPSQMHRLLKVQGLIAAGGQMQFQMDAQGPIANNRAIFRRLCEILEGPNADQFIHAPQPPQAAPPPPEDPRVTAAKINAQSKTDQGAQRLQADQLEHEQKMAEIAVESSDKEADRQAATQRELLKTGASHAEKGADMVSTAIGHAQDEKQQNQQQQHEKQQALTAPLLAPTGGGDNSTP